MNTVRFNYDVFTHKPETRRKLTRLWFKLYCQRWRSFQGNRQSGAV